MKKILGALLMVIVATLSVCSVAQEVPKIPVDPNVRIGKLKNGLTYYIRHNEYPKGQAEYFIAQKVGSIMEEDNQRGLAHFLEHMCFNGTKSFPGNGIIKWCESVGVKFGYNLNAYTSIERTVYNISSVPTARESVQDSCLLILHDWANDLLLDPKEIDSERSVIHEEWRSQMSPSQRIMEKLLPIMYPNNRYGYRFPIGTMEVVDNFPHQALRDYYEKWYRPDLQGILVVGDIDVDRIESKIKEMFSSIEMPENAAERTIFQVDDNKETIYAIGSDKEQAMQQVYIMFKHDAVKPEQKNGMDYLMLGYATEMASSMLNNRLSEMGNKADAPFARAVAYDGDYFVANTKGAFNVLGVAKNDIKATFESVYREALRAKRHGFTATEYVRAREEYLSELENRYKNRNQIESNTLVEEYVENFLDNEPIPGIENEYQIMSMLAKQIPVDVVNQVFQEKVNPDSNVVVMMLLPDKPEVVKPTDAELATIMHKVDGEIIDAYVDNVKQEPLIEKLPKKGSIKKEEVNKEFDAKEWTLSNGAKVIYKKTDLKDDEILFRAYAKGGLSVYPESEADNLRVMQLAVGQISLGSFTSNDLQKYLAGKQASVGHDISDYSRGLEGNSTPKDLQTLMELIYMMFTDPRLDAEEYEANISSIAAVLAQRESTPQFVFQKKRREALYSQPRNQMLSVETLKNAKRERIEQMLKDLYNNAADYTFVFVGNFDEAVLRGLVEQYIASIPGNAKKATHKVQLAGLGMNRGTYEKNYTTKMEVPQVYASMSYVGDMPYTTKNSLVASFAGQIMSTRLLEKVREKEGATYSIGAHCSLNRFDDEAVKFSTTFPMKPEKKDVVYDIIKKEFEAMTHDVTAEEVKKVREFMTKQYEDQLKKNGYWMSNIVSYQVLPVNNTKVYKQTLDSITEKDVQKFVADLIKQGNFSVVFLNPEETK